jgi:magnesium transporter
LIDNARTKILTRKTKVQQYGVDYLLCWLIRALFTENYFSLFSQFMERVRNAEEALLNGATDAAVYRDVVDLRRELGPFERSLLYADQFAGVLIHEKPEVLGKAALSYFTEVLVNETNRLEKEFSILRDRTTELIQIYRDNINTQLNNIMRIIAVISTIFLPLSFITGFYGMNFPNMPALKWSGSFPIVVATMVLLVTGSLIYARKKKWL